MGIQPPLCRRYEAKVRQFRTMWYLDETVSCLTEETTGECYVCRAPSSFSFEFWAIIDTTSTNKKMENSVFVDSASLPSIVPLLCDFVVSNMNVRNQFCLATPSVSSETKSQEIIERVLRSFDFKGDLKQAVSVLDSWFVVGKPLLMSSIQTTCLSFPYGFKKEDAENRVYWTRPNNSLRLLWYRSLDPSQEINVQYSDNRGRKRINSLLTAQVVVDEPNPKEMENILCSEESKGNGEDDNNDNADDDLPIGNFQPHGVPSRPERLDFPPTVIGRFWDYYGCPIIL